MIPQWTKNKNKGYIVESGSNNNGSYIKFSDGTMICYKVTDVITMDLDVAWGSMYEGSVEIGQFPANFTETPAISASPFNSGMLVEQAGANATKNSWGLVTAVRPTAVQNVSARFYLIAIGKWK